MVTVRLVKVPYGRVRGLAPWVRVRLESGINKMKSKTLKIEYV